MEYYLLELKINGIKSIDKKIELDFCNKQLNNKFDASKFHVKAIYGTNGAGKTGIVYAIRILKNLILNKDYLTIQNANNGNKLLDNELQNIINQHKKELYVSVIFANIDNEILEGIYKYEIILKNKNNEYCIESEMLSKLVGYKLLDEKFKIIFEVKQGILQNISINEYNTIQEKTLNLLEKQSFISTIHPLLQNIDNIDENFVNNINSVIGFALNTICLLLNSDVNNISFFEIYNQINVVNKVSQQVGNQLTASQIFNSRLEKKLTEIVPKYQFCNYEKYVSNLTKFIKVFRSDLKNIEINKIDVGLYYECEKIMNYGDQNLINEKYESTGIKKLITLYSSLCAIEKHKIVFIDEFDANIHDVLLTKLVEYIAKYTKGQFIFTTHNLAPMEVLKNYKHSIDFLSNDSEIVSWVKNGHYSPVNQYRDGFIKKSPFNIQACDFLGAFDNE